MIVSRESSFAGSDLYVEENLSSPLVIVLQERLCKMKWETTIKQNWYEEASQQVFCKCYTYLSE